MSDYLYDLDGDVIAFRRSWDDEHVFDTSGRWIGWIPVSYTHLTLPTKA